MASLPIDDDELEHAPFGRRGRGWGCERRPRGEWSLRRGGAPAEPGPSRDEEQRSVVDGIGQTPLQPRGQARARAEERGHRLEIAGDEGAQDPTGLVLGMRSLALVRGSDGCHHDPDRTGPRVQQPVSIDGHAITCADGNEACPVGQERETGVGFRRVQRCHRPRASGRWGLG